MSINVSPKFIQGNLVKKTVFPVNNYSSKIQNAYNLNEINIKQNLR